MKKLARGFSLETWLVCGLVWFILTACSSKPTAAGTLELLTATPPHTPTVLPTHTRTPRLPTQTATPTLLPTATFTPQPFSIEVVIDAAVAGEPFAPYILGSNLPAWLNPERFEDEQFRRRVAASGITLLRIPGGSWGDEYGWLSCEQGKDAPGAFPCRYPWAANPTDFINFFRGLESLGASIEPMYIVNVNYTAQEAAALVAFFNSPQGDPTLIGVDRNGTDWKTAGDWAALRAAGGNPEPLDIRWWEIGNEVHGGKPGGSGCKNPNGWEETWTCKPDEYMLGDSAHDGALALRAAMQAVDPDILVGVVGGSDSVQGNRWSEAVLVNGKGQFDYFVIHTYPNYNIYGNLPKEFGEILALPQTHWGKLMRSAQAGFKQYVEGWSPPVVVNEYELIPPYGKEDFRNYMNKHIDALFIADSIGQMLVHGVDIAAQWDVMNGKSDSYGNEFGLMRADGSNFRQPKYYVFPLWSRFGAAVLPVQSSADPASQVSVYAGRLADGGVSLMLINKTGSDVQVNLTVQGVSSLTGGLADVLSAPTLDSPQAVFNGITEPGDDLTDAAPMVLPAVQDNHLTYHLVAFSVTLLRLSTNP